jgi:hypothetical protein
MKGLLHELIENFATYTLILAGAAATFVLFYGRDRLPEWIRSLRAGSWRTASDSIETADVTTVRGTGPSGLRKVELTKASLGYSHQIDGAFYSGYFSKAFTDEQAAWDFADKWKGRDVMIRYNPARPDVSVLRMEDQLGGEAF